MDYITFDKLDNSRFVKIVIRCGTEIFLPNVPIFNLSLIMHGNCSLEINKQAYEIHAPAILCLDNQKEVRVLSTSDLYVRTIFFDPQFINRNMTIETMHSNEYSHLVEQHSFLQLSPFIQHNDDFPSYFVLDDELYFKVKDIVNNCIDELDAQSDWYWSCRVRSYLMEILTYLERIYYNYGLGKKDADFSKGTPSTQIVQVMKYIDGNIRDSITLNDICQKFAINRTALQKTFKKHANMTFHNYLVKCRIERASYMLRFTELPLDEISERSGFSSTANFCKFFKKQTGISPDRFRKETVEQRIEWQNNRVD